MKILLLIPSISIGGGEIFALRLATELSKHHEIMVCDANFPHQQPETDISDLNSTPGLIYKKLKLPLWPFLKPFYQNATRLPINAFLNLSRKTQLLEIIRDFKPDVINSHLISADYLVASIRNKLSCKWLISMHGSYENDLNHRLQKKKSTLQKCDGVVYPADKNLAILKTLNQDASVFKLKKIYHGFTRREVSEPEKQELRKKLRLADKTFVFVMMARADVQKGWEEAILAFQKANLPGAVLLLFGQGQYLEKLKVLYPPSTRLIYLEEQKSLFTAISISHVGLLPTYYPTESLPNSVIEYLSYGLPVLATDIGEISHMLSTNSGMAGALIPYLNGKADINVLSELMNSFYSDKNWYDLCCRRAEEASKKFNLELYCISYLSFIQEQLLITKK